MFEIKGKYTTAQVYAKVIEDEAIAQIQKMCNAPFSEGAHVAIMPDVHAGKGCTIGTTMTVQDKIVPNIVGVDIGCGMYTIKLKEKEIDFAKLDEAAHKVPSGCNVWEKPTEEFDFNELRCFNELENIKWLSCSLGSLGGGNHFIEVDQASDGTLYLVIHSGSRNLGKQVADYYQRCAIDLQKGKKEYLAEHERIITEYKKNGNSKEIQNALKKLMNDYRNKRTEMPEELCHLYGAEMDDYLHDVEICQKFALRNREIIAGVLLKEAGLHSEESFHTIHNYIDVKEMILRKGSIAAHKGEKVLIPINMRDGSILAYGKGNEAWNCSAPHGAGRIMSRCKAKSQLNLDEYKKAMEGIYTTSVNYDTIDEAPMAYKSLADIIDVVQESVDIIEVIKPVYNFKASE